MIVILAAFAVAAFVVTLVLMLAFVIAHPRRFVGFFSEVKAAQYNWESQVDMINLTLTRLENGRLDRDFIVDFVAANLPGLIVARGPRLMRKLTRQGRALKHPTPQQLEQMFVTRVVKAALDGHRLSY